MDDLISRKAVLEATSTTLKITGEENAKIVYGYIKKLCDDIKALPSAQQWIPCSERLPEEGISVLGTFEGEFGNFTLRTARLVFDGKDVWCSGQGLSAIAWMPLPEPYKKEER